MCVCDGTILGPDAVAEITSIHAVTPGVSPPFRLHATTGADFAVEGEVDPFTAPLLGRVLAAVGDTDRHGELVIDARGLEFIEHCSLLTLERYASRHGARGGAARRLRHRGPARRATRPTTATKTRPPSCAPDPRRPLTPRKPTRRSQNSSSPSPPLAVVPLGAWGFKSPLRHQQRAWSTPGTRTRRTGKRGGIGRRDDAPCNGAEGVEAVGVGEAFTAQGVGTAQVRLAPPHWLVRGAEPVRHKRSTAA